MRAGYFLGAALGTTVLTISGCGNSSLSLGDGGGRAACYYMSDADYNGAVDLFREIGAVYPRDWWLENNPYFSCDAFPDIDAPRVPREDCERCMNAVFDAADFD